MGTCDDAADKIDAATVTRLLKQAGSDDSSASDALLPLVYDQLRRLAKKQMRQQRADHTLQATALVHEAYLRLVDQTCPQKWDGRWHFFAAAAEAMRRILVENARRKDSLKQGGRRQRVSLDDAPAIALDRPPDDLLALNDALQELQEKSPEKAKLVKLRFFAGLTIEQAAEATGISASTADRHWAYARAWLYRRMGRNEAR